jgi:CRP-like cAMP-binding protein
VSRSSSAAYLLARARTPEPTELAEMAWLQALLPNERERALADLKVVQVEVGELLCRVGRPVTYWFGVVDGLLKMSNDTAMGVPITFTGIAPGGWFGEGTVIKREAYRYNIQALRKSVVAGLSVDTFHWLLDRSIPVQPLHRPAAQRAARPVHRRARDRPARRPDARVARSLAALFHPILYPGRRLAAAHHPAGARLPGRACRGSASTRR